MGITVYMHMVVFTIVRHMIYKTFIVLCAFLMRQTKLLLVLHIDELLCPSSANFRYYLASMLAGNEKNINIRTISGTLGYAWLVPVCLRVAGIRFTHQ